MATLIVVSSNGERFFMRRTMMACLQVMAAAMLLAVPQVLRSDEPNEHTSSASENVQEVESIATRLEQRFGMSAIDAVRLHLWSRFGTVERFARDLDFPTSLLQSYLAEHRWALFDAPALKVQNRTLDGLQLLGVSSEEKARQRFVTFGGQPSTPATNVTISSDPNAISISVTCDEPELSRLTSAFPRNDPLSPRERWY